MIIYDRRYQADFSFKDFGIDIPILECKRRKTLAWLRRDPALAALLERVLYEEPLPLLEKDDLLSVHDPAYVERLYSDQEAEQAVLEAFELVDASGAYHRYHPDRARRSLSVLRDQILREGFGTALAVRTAAERGFAYYFGGGFHHGHRDFGHGFCLFNDLAVAVKTWQKTVTEGARDVWIIDVDAHRGDGTAALFASDPEVKTLSIHMARGWPLDLPQLKEDGTLEAYAIPGDVEIPVESGEEPVYGERLREGLKKLEAGGLPRLALVVSGADPYEKDILPSTRLLRLSKEQLAERDRSLFLFLKERKIPTAYVMAGGYGEAVWEIYARFLEWLLPRAYED